MGTSCTLGEESKLLRPKSQLMFFINSYFVRYIGAFLAKFHAPVARLGGKPQALVGAVENRKRQTDRIVAFAQAPRGD